MLNTEEFCFVTNASLGQKVIEAVIIKETSAFKSGRTKSGSGTDGGAIEAKHPNNYS